MPSVLGQYWRNQDHPLGRMITREYTDESITDDDGLPIKWVEFGTPSLTYAYQELAERGWESMEAPQ